MPLTRNLRLSSDQEQQQLAESTVLVAGVGGVGGRVAETLARVGVGHLIVADPDDFAVSNLIVNSESQSRPRSSSGQPTTKRE